MWLTDNNMDHLKELIKQQIELFKEMDGCKDYTDEELFDLAYEQLTDILENYNYFDFKN